MFQTFAAVLILIVFLVPGYIWRSIEGRFIYLDNRLPWEKYALGLLARSTIIYIPLFSFLYKGWKAIPVTAGLIFGIARQKDWVGFLLRLKYMASIRERIDVK